MKEQVEAYCTVFEAFAGRKVVIRTLDAGADKPQPFIGQAQEANPALGVRGLRVARRRPELLTDQLTLPAVPPLRERASPREGVPRNDHRLHHMLGVRLGGGPRPDVLLERYLRDLELRLAGKPAKMLRHAKQRPVDFVFHYLPLGLIRKPGEILREWKVLVRASSAGPTRTAGCAESRPARVPEQKS